MRRQNISSRDSTQLAAADALIALLAERFSRIFSVFERRRKPLKVGIAADLAALGVASVADLKRALRRYCRNSGYLAGLREGAERLDLDGLPAGKVTATEATFAAMLLDARRAKAALKKPPDPAKPKPAKPKPKPPAKPAPSRPSAPGRIGLADLKRAAIARRAGQ
jgi:ProP effector